MVQPDKGRLFIQKYVKNGEWIFFKLEDAEWLQDTDWEIFWINPEYRVLRLFEAEIDLNVLKIFKIFKILRLENYNPDCWYRYAIAEFDCLWIKQNKMYFQVFEF